MRQLTAKQKKLLDKVSDERKLEGKATLDYLALPDEILKELERMNDTEILYQEINRYLWDRNFIN